MKLCSFAINDMPRVGVKTDAGVIDLTAMGFSHSMFDIIKGGGAAQAAIACILQNNPLIVLSEESITFLPVTEPEKIICVGLNYAQHAKETGGDPPEHPVFFNKFHDALTASGSPVTLPPWCRSYDYEAELVIVVGRQAYNVPTADAEDYIFGYTCGNDLSARDAQFLSSQWLSGKSFPGFAPAGPFVVTKDSFDPYAGNSIRCEVNGQTVQSSDTSDMIFGCREILSAASRFFPLSPGDLIFTGTPSGVIMGKPSGQRVWLRPGDVVSVTIDGIGTLTTPLV